MIECRDIKIADNIEDLIKVSDNQLLIKIKNPTVNIDQENDWLILLKEIHLERYNEHDILVFFPLMEEYFHNFFEMFPYLLYLKNNNIKFKVVLVGASLDEKMIDNIFISLIRDNNISPRNTAHVKDFLDYFKIEYLCIEKNKLKNLNCNSTFLSYYKSIRNKSPITDIKINNDIYISNYFTHFTEQHKKIYIENIEIIKKEFPKYDVSANKKIFISRSKNNARKYKYEPELEDMLKKIGYEIINLQDYALFDQIKIVKSSSHLVCMYGSSLINPLTFCTNTKILSINYTKKYHVEAYDILDSLNITPHTKLNITLENTIEDIKEKILNWE